ncbi:VIT1/CCC1 transporter family protein [Lentilactobacillus laojiaonis]|uniref:VIT1/CCC1 transporter family protein n=1 Tax=Lentilactobacillus laojiaonis TaxID=2883998 RepID=UPI001D0A2552|nr:VIT family protein [Lentilactobacillus laojiaonis]UDM32127.1 VIT family protein [Lentilactobacillus laojiaonis]
MTKKNKSKQTMDEKLNTLRAGVLGSNDGILTVVGVLFSVAIATTDPFTIFIAGLADLLACAFSMASGEYASVSTQKDTEKSAVVKENLLIKTNFKDELKVVQDFYIQKGVSEETAYKIAEDLMHKNPLKTVVSVKYNIQIGHYLNPWEAAFSSLFAAALGGSFPLLAMTLTPEPFRWPVTILSVCLSVALTGFISAKLGDGNTKEAVTRNVIVGIITMIIHYSLGMLL